MSINRIPTKKKTIVARSIPLAALILLVTGALVGYLASELMLTTRSHPIHWIAAGIAALLGFMVGIMFVERFGDIA